MTTNASTVDVANNPFSNLADIPVASSLINSKRYQRVLLYDNNENPIGIGASPVSLTSQGKIVGTALTTSFAEVLQMDGDALAVTVMNSCDQAVTVSLDNGTTEFELDAFESWTQDYGANGLYLPSDKIMAKASSTIPKVGSIRAWIQRR